MNVQFSHAYANEGCKYGQMFFLKLHIYASSRCYRLHSVIGIAKY